MLLRTKQKQITSVIQLFQLLSSSVNLKARMSTREHINRMSDELNLSNLISSLSFDQSYSLQFGHNSLFLIVLKKRKPGGGFYVNLIANRRTRIRHH